jgi:hypothetical protein
MLQHFSVNGFRCFDKNLSFYFAAVEGNDFSETAIENRLVKTGIIVANSGEGKTALGMAIFDLTRHLARNQVISMRDLDMRFGSTSKLINHDLDMSFGSTSELMEYKYQFRFEHQNLSYEYARSASGYLVYERIVIDGELYAEVDRRIVGGATILAAGAESLRRDISQHSTSVALHIHKNATLEKNDANECFKKFINFAENMLYFSAEDINSYAGFTKGMKDAGTIILENGWIEDLAAFLNQCGLEYRLTIESLDGKGFIGQRIGYNTANLLRIASPGVKKLINFFCWMKSAMAEENKASFIYADGMDGLHHLASGPVFQLAIESSAQMLIATSSTGLLNQNDVRPDCCFSLRNGSIESFFHRTKKQLRPAHNLERLYRAGAFD